MEKKAVIRDFLFTKLIKDPPDELGDESPLLTSGLVDSLAIVRLVTFLEDRFGVAIPLEDVTIENFENLSLLDAYLQQRFAG